MVVELVDVNSELRPTLQVYNLWCKVETVTISIKNTFSRVKSVFLLSQFAFKSK